MTEPKAPVKKRVKKIASNQYLIQYTKEAQHGVIKDFTHAPLAKDAWENLKQRVYDSGDYTYITLISITYLGKYNE